MLKEEEEEEKRGRKRKRGFCLKLKLQTFLAYSQFSHYFDNFLLQVL